MTLHIAGISAHYIPDTPVLRNVTLDIAPGSVTAILGASGSGKTTLFRVLAGLHTPTSGTIHLTRDGHTTNLTSLSPQARHVGLVPQDGALFPHLTVAQNIAYGLRGVSARRAATDPRVAQYAALVGLEGLEERLPHQLSGGQQQRVALARALAPQPDFVLMDEPFSSLDPDLRQHIRHDLLTILREQGVPVILVTHDAYEALSSTDTIALLRHGTLEQVGTPHEIYTRPRSVWTANFLGKASFLPATFTGTTAHTPLGNLPLLGAPTGADTHVLLRPEHLSVHATHQEGSHAATLRGIQYYGHAALLELRLDAYPDQVLLARVPPEASPVSPGQACFISVHTPVHALSNSLKESLA